MRKQCYFPSYLPSCAYWVRVEGLNEIKNNLKISREQIAERLRIKPGTVKEYIKKLKDKGVLRRVGKTSGGHWEVLK